MANIIVMLKRHYQKKDGSYPIVLQVNVNGKQKYLYTKCSVTPDQWDDLKWVKRSHKDYELINQAIESQRRLLSDNMTQAEKSGRPIDINSIGRPKEARSFSGYLRKRLSYFKEKGNINMEYKVNADIREIEHVGGGEVFYNDIDVTFLKKLEVYFRGIGNHQNTIERKFRNLRTHYKAATIEDGAPFPNPFDQLRFKKEPVSRTKLTPEEIYEIEQLNLSGSVQVVRDIFLFSIYTQGMRFENVLTLRKDQVRDGSIFYKMNKGKKYRSIEIYPINIPIIDTYMKTPGRYLFPLLEDREYTTRELYFKKGSENARINAVLKYIAEMANIKSNVTFHTARHSFAWKFYQAYGGGHIDVLKDAMGHSDVQITQHYLKSLDDGYIDDKVRNIF